MNLKIFFNPVDESLYQDIDDFHSFFENIHVHNQDFPEYQDMDIALIGLSEVRGTVSNKGAADAANAIRKKLYKLKRGYGRYKIIDLGNLVSGRDQEDTVFRLKEICRILLTENVLPILIGGSHDLDLGQFLAYEELGKLINMVNVDAFLDLEFDNSMGLSRGHINQILLHNPSYLLHYTQLGYQTYLSSRESLDVMEKLFFDMLRLGQVRQNIKECEPFIRDADMISFDISAIRIGDAPGNANAQPFGLSGEEACQICWYAGLNDKLSSAGFYEYNPELDNAHGQTASVVATMIWYFVEGFYHRRQEKDFTSNDYMKYIVEMPRDKNGIIFYKSKFTDKWWMEVSNDLQRPYPEKSLIPCSFSDYEAATRGQFPERYLNTNAKYF
jgi:formiminoglutamase